MRKSTSIIRLFSISILLGFVLFGTNMVTSKDASAARFFACLPGFAFSVNNNAARCYKPARFVYRALKKCPIVLGVGYGLVRDFKRGSNIDFCVTQLPGNSSVQATLPTACDRGYSKQVRRGKDRCRKRIPASTRAPSRAVNR